MVKGTLPGSPSGTSWPSPTLERHLMARSIPAWLYHFTSTAGLIGIANDEALFSTHIAYLNDTAERHHAMGIVVEAITARKNREDLPHEREFFRQALGFTSTRRAYAPRTFVTSFAETESLAMYRMYCLPDEGYAIGVPGDRLSLMAERQKFELYPCIYDVDEQRQIADELVESILTDFRRENEKKEELKRSRGTPPMSLWFNGMLIPWAGELWSNFAPLFKHPSFEGEKEWRIVKTLRGDSNDKLFSRKGIRGITPYIRFRLLRSSELYPTSPYQPHNHLNITPGPSGVDALLRKEAVEMLFESFEPVSVGGQYDTPYRA